MSGRTVLLGFAATISLAACAGGPGSPSAGTGGAGQPARIVITDVDVVDVVSGEIVADRTVTVGGGRIRALFDAGGPGARAATATAETVVDGGGKYLIPGLWDAHVHFRGGAELVEANRKLLPLYVANGVTTVRDGGGDITGAVLRWNDAVTDGDLVGPRILTSGPKLDGPRGGWDGSIRMESPAEVPAAIDSLDALGTDYVKIYDGSVSREVYLAIVEETERRGRIVSGHMPFSVRFGEAVDAGLDITDHLYYAFKGGSPVEDSLTQAIIAGEGPGFWDALWVMMEGRDPARERALYERMAEAGTAAVPTLHIGEVLAWVDEVDHSTDPELRFIDPAVEETYQGRVRSAERSPDRTRELTRELRGMLADMVAPMHEAGVTILAGSDGGPFNSYVYPGFSLHAELEELVEAGLTPLDALRAATLNPAEVMGLGGESGRVAPGYRADLVLLDANPLDDIRHTRAIDRVILRGEQIFAREELGALLEVFAR